MSKWINYESTCTHGGYGVCHEGCKVSGIWELDSEGEPSRFIAQCLWLKDLPLIAAAPDMFRILKELLMPCPPEYAEATEQRIKALIEKVES